MMGGKWLLRWDMFISQVTGTSSVCSGKAVITTKNLLQSLSKQGSNLLIGRHHCFLQDLCLLRSSQKSNTFSNLEIDILLHLISYPFYFAFPWAGVKSLHKLTLPTWKELI